MAIHTELDIYKAAYDLLGVAVDAVSNMRRDAKPVVGGRLLDECRELLVLVRRANSARDKAPHIDTLLDRLEAATVLIRVSRDKRLIANSHYAQAARLAVSIGRQASGWKKQSTAPVA